MYGFNEFREEILKHFPPEPEGCYLHRFKPGEMAHIYKRSAERPPALDDVRAMAHDALKGMKFNAGVFESDVTSIPCKSEGSIVVQFPSDYFFSFAAEAETSRYACINVGWRGDEKMTEEKYKKYIRLLELYFNFPE